MATAIVQGGGPRYSMYDNNANPSSSSSGESDGEEEEILPVKETLLLADFCHHCYHVDDLNALTRKMKMVHVIMDHSQLLDHHEGKIKVFVWAKRASMFIVGMILVSTICFILQSMPELRTSDGLEWSGWETIELVVSVTFTLEYLVRFLVAKEKLKFVVEPLNVVDLLAILPFYIKLGVDASDSEQLRILRVIRLARIFRLFKMSRHSKYLQIFGQALSKSADAFILLVFFIAMGLVIFSSLMFYAERGECVFVDTDLKCDVNKCTGLDSAECVYRRDPVSNGDEAFSPFFSIPTTFWWCLVTMTTVGYGDVVPTTTWGKFISAATMICGILVLALPISILGTNFQQAYNEHRSAAQQKKTQSLTKRIKKMERLAEEFEQEGRGVIESIKLKLRREGGHKNHLAESVTFLHRASISSIENEVEFVRALNASEIWKKASHAPLLERLRMATASRDQDSSSSIRFPWKKKNRGVSDSDTSVANSAKGKSSKRSGIESGSDESDDDERSSYSK